MKRFSEFLKKLLRGGAPSKKALTLLIVTIVVAMIPNFILASTEQYGAWSIVASILIPIGFYMILLSLIRLTGASVLLGIWIFILCAFQIVLLFLWGQSIIATDMFTNLITTNPSEASELLSNLSDAIFTVCIIYGPVLIYAVYASHKHFRITKKMRRALIITGFAVGTIGGLALIPARLISKESVFLNEVFPANVLYNLTLSISNHYKVKRYSDTSEDFNYRATRTDNPSDREIYIYIIGEAARAANWSLYGYNRDTNPILSKRNDIVLLHNTLTQSNTTHKSVPLLLTSVGAHNHSEIYNRTGIASIFGDTGFKTYFISNQTQQGALVDLLADQADERVYIGAPRYDIQLLNMMKRIIESEKEGDLFFILHCYGSHYAYNLRYPQEFSHFKPDNDIFIDIANKEQFVNSYDNSIRYTDMVLNEIIEYIDSLNVYSTLLYCSDHGEDVFDDERMRFLHASPTITYHQVHVAAMMWFSDKYRQRYPNRVSAAESNNWSPITTYSMFHTMCDAASISSPYIDKSVALTNAEFDKHAKRYYLDDHNQAVAFDKKQIGITNIDKEQFRQHGITQL